MKNPLVSIIITTKNEEKNIEKCLQSIKGQTYINCEIIVVDNNSSDFTKRIAQKYTDLIFDKGPERSAQRNFGVKKATGIYVLFIDADMLLTKDVVSQCVFSILKERVGGIIIPEKSFGTGFWAECKMLERSFYVGNDNIEAARFFDKKKFIMINGYDEMLTGPEDWDLSQKVKASYGLARIKEFILHNEGNLSLNTTLKKKYYYAKKFASYMQKKTNKQYAVTQFSIGRRYWIFLSRPYMLFKNPVLGFGVLFMKTAEFIAGALGFFEGKYNIK